MSGQGQYYPPQQPQPYQPYPKQGIEQIFIAKDKMGLWMILCGALFFIGILLLDLMASRLVDPEEALYFLGYLMVDLGIIGFVVMLIVGGIYRDDLPEKVRNVMILAAAIIIIMFVIVYLSRGLSSLLSYY